MTERRTRTARDTDARGAEEACQQIALSPRHAAHGAHMRWVVDPADGVNKAIFDKIVSRHASGAELLIRFAPGTAPATANPR